MTFAYANTQYARPRQVQVIATEPDYFKIKSYNLTSGRVFSPQVAALGTPVVVIGTEVASHFFRGLDPLGRELRIGVEPGRQKEVVYAGALFVRIDGGALRQGLVL